MKLLLTSAGICNKSIHAELVELLGKPISQCSALIIPTAIYAFRGGAQAAWRIIAGKAVTPLSELGWDSLGVLELSALPSIEQDHWLSVVRETDVLLVGGGDPLYLYSWMRKSGLSDIFSSLHETVYVGVSAGSLVMTPHIGKDFVYGTPTAEGDAALGMVDFSIFPHLDNPDMPEFSMTPAEGWAAGLSNPSYAIDDQTAIRVVDGEVDIISEGHWKYFAPRPE